MSHAVKLKEMGPRDGLQNEVTTLLTQSKLQMIRALVDAGLSYIEATAFVSPKAIPQLADAEAVAAGLPSAPGVTFSALVPNKQGLERALTCGLKEVAVFTAASETFNQKNIRTSIDGSFERFKEVFPSAQTNGVRVRGYVSTSFFCPFEGEISPGQAADVIHRLIDAGCYEVSIGDTIGKATPTHVERLLSVVLKRIPADQLAGHFHDTYGMAVANVWKSYELGLRTFDSSVGGLGGCPYAPGASGNVSTNELVRFFEDKGISTGVNLEKLNVITKNLEKELGRKLSSNSTVR